jgi:restriction system protein
MSVHVGDLAVQYNARGNPTYVLEVSHPGLRKHRVIRGNEAAIVQRKARIQVEEWTAKWSAQQQREKEKRNQQRQRETADSRTAEAVAELQGLENLLAHTLSIDDAIDWDELKDRSPFPEQLPSAPAKPPRPSTDVQLSILDRLIKSRRERRVADVQQRLAKYEAQVKRMDQEHAQKVKGILQG